MINVEEYVFWLSEFATVMSVIWSVRLVGLGRKIFILEIRGSNPLRTTINASVAQGLERQTVNLGVIGSNPI